jgi:hypothetical protein
VLLGVRRVQEKDAIRIDRFLEVLHVLLGLVQPTVRLGAAKLYARGDYDAALDLFALLLGRGRRFTLGRHALYGLSGELGGVRYLVILSCQLAR